MASTGAFIIWFAFMVAAYDEVYSFTAYNEEEQCKRLTNELDENNIVKHQQRCASRKTLNDYFQDRQDLLNYELETSLGGDVKLTENEELANKIIMEAKENEYKAGFLNPYGFNPSRHIFEVLDAVKQSNLFQIIRKMPKGGILHAHDTALCSADYVVSLTYWPNLWQSASNKSNNIEAFRFSREQPINSNGESTWRLVKDVRTEVGATKYDAQIRTLFTLFDKNINPRVQFKDINDVWDRFMAIFIRVESILTYAPIWKAYYKHALKEMQEDGVQYLEFRGTLPKVFIEIFRSHYNVRF